MRWIVAVFILTLAAGGLTGAQSPSLTCPAGSTVWLAGTASPAGTALLVRFDGRYVGGGSVKAGGGYRIPLMVDGATRPGTYRVQVEVRDTRQIVQDQVCVVGGIQPTATARPTATQQPAATTTPDRTACDPSYPDVCIEPYPPDLNCEDVPYTNFRVDGDDLHAFDADDDGIGCET